MKELESVLRVVGFAISTALTEERSNISRCQNPDALLANNGSSSGRFEELVNEINGRASLISLNDCIVANERRVVFDYVMRVKEFQIDAISEIVALEQAGDAHKNTHAKTRAEIVRRTQDFCKFRKLDISSIARENADIGECV